MAVGIMRHRGITINRDIIHHLGITIIRDITTIRHDIIGIIGGRNSIKERRIVWRYCIFLILIRFRL